MPSCRMRLLSVVRNGSAVVSLRFAYHHHVTAIVSSHEGQTPAIKRVGEPVNPVGFEVGDLPRSAPIERLTPQIRYPVARVDADEGITIMRPLEHWAACRRHIKCFNECAVVEFGDDDLWKLRRIVNKMVCE